MDKIYVKVIPGYEQTGTAIKYYLQNKGEDCDLVSSDEEFAKKKHLYKKIVELGPIHCINNYLFSNMGVTRSLKALHYGPFSYKKMIDIPENVHVFSESRWPIHNFVSTIKYEELGELGNLYKEFLSFEEDPEWIAASFAACGCDVKHKDVITVDEYAKSLGL